ncbi:MULTISPECIES: hypothetical protein [unclassified Nostoc]|uniref:hypothetical protein n=1 Tax=unclassified Nostoc TaxID=2593658 RepID=UPI0025AAB985|nr:MULTISPECIES: hypothetical protein [unclassified Nostoc]MDM9583928.1 hypothetical protein [Nostoc sp. GT001]MDZ7945152.1 hypothetical protein [Nostoc sp. EfeVER01]MDZ7991561.1 hypothetical protein [Nostoc sp. EspVER01]
MTPNPAIASPESIGECLKAIAIANYLNIYLYSSTYKLSGNRYINVIMEKLKYILGI